MSDETTRAAALPALFPGGRHWERAIIVSLVVFAAAALVAAIAMGGDGWARLATLSWPVVAGLLALSLANYALRAARWHLYGRAVDVDLGAGTGSLIYLAGFAFTTTPGRVGEAVRLWMMRRLSGVALERTLPMLIADRVSDLAAVALLLLFGLNLVLNVPELTIVASVAAALTLVLVIWPGAAGMAVNVAYAGIGRWPRLFVRLRRAAASTAALFRPSLALPALLLGTAGWLAECAAFALVLKTFGADIGLAPAMLVFTAGMLAGALTFIPGGLGGTEATMLALLALLSVPLPIALSATLVIRVTTLWFAVALGFLVLPWALRIVRRGTP
jgi:uncharacterized membrane protein YbhN (UPF0104 family)